MNDFIEPLTNDGITDGLLWACRVVEKASLQASRGKPKLDSFPRLSSDPGPLEEWCVFPHLIHVLVVYGHGSLKDTVGNLFYLLQQDRADGDGTRDGEPIDYAEWPGSPKHLSVQVRRYQPALRKAGIYVGFVGHTSEGNLLHLNLRDYLRNGTREVIEAKSSPD